MSGLPPPPPSYGPSASPYAGPYGNVVPSGRPVRSLDGLSLAASIMLGIMAALCVFGLVAFARRASVLDDFLNGSGRTLGLIDDIDDADDLVGAASLLYVLGLLATAAVFIPWQFRHGRNAEALVGRMGLGAEWAIAGWFIPCANYVLPGVQLFQASTALDAHVDPRAPVRGGRGSALVIVWAIAFGLGTVLFGVSRALFPSDNELARNPDAGEDAISADRVAAGAFLVLLVAAVLAIVMVRSLSKRQAARAAALRAGGYGYGAPPPGYGAPPPGVPGYGAPPGPGGPPGYGHGPPPGQGGAPGPGTGWSPPGS